MVGCCHRQLSDLIFLGWSSSMLIATVSARRHDGSEFIEIKFDDGL
jgi:hypothetical protein